MFDQTLNQHDFKNQIGNWSSKKWCCVHQIRYNHCALNGHKLHKHDLTRADRLFCILNIPQPSKKDFTPSMSKSKLGFRTSRGPRRLHQNFITSFATRNFYPSRRRWRGRPGRRWWTSTVCPRGVQLFSGFVAVESSFGPIMVYQ